MIFSILKYNKQQVDSVRDTVAEELPLLISATHTYPLPEQPKAIALTMRSPGDDEDLIRGFLFTENIIESFDDILSIEIPNSNSPNAEHQEALVRLRPGKKIALNKIDRNLYTSSSCGVCGKSSIDNLQTIGNYLLPDQNNWISYQTLCELADQVFLGQKKFKETGGVHATALLPLDTLQPILREDVGRHNAMDKAIGGMSLLHKLPFSHLIAFVSGRASFELVQKAYLCGITMLCSYGAPSSLAIDLARKVNMTLVGFLKNDRCNVYSGGQRLYLNSKSLTLQMNNR